MGHSSHPPSIMKIASVVPANTKFNQLCSVSEIVRFKTYSSPIITMTTTTIGLTWAQKLHIVTPPSRSMKRHTSTHHVCSISPIWGIWPRGGVWFKGRDCEECCLTSRQNNDICVGGFWHTVTFEIGLWRGHGDCGSRTRESTVGRLVFGELFGGGACVGIGSVCMYLLHGVLVE